MKLRINKNYLIKAIESETYRRLEPVTDLTKRVLTTKLIRPKTFHQHIISLVGKKV